MNLQHVLDLGKIQLLQVSLMITAASLAMPLLRRRPHLAYVLWLAVLIKSVTPPIWSSPLGVFSHRQAVAHASVEQSTVVFDAAPSAHAMIATITATPKITASHTLNIAELLSITCAIGCVTFLLIVAIRWIALQRRIARSSIEPSRNLAEMLDQVRDQLGMTRRIPLRVCDDPIGPAVIGLLRPALVIPAEIVRNKSSTQLRLLLAHEIIHLRRGDPFVAMLQLISQAIWWFNPLVWWMNRQIIRTREICCDAEVIASLQCPREGYAQMLIDVLRLRKSVGAPMAWPAIRPVHITMRRLNQIMTDGPAHRRTPWTYWALLAICALVVLPGAAMSDDSPQAPTKSSPDSNAGPAAPTDDHPTLADLTQLQLQIVSQIDQLEKNGYLEQNPQIISLKAKLADIERQISDREPLGNLAAPPAQNLTVRHFLAIVVDVDGIHFQGQSTSVDRLSEALAKVPDRPHTVLELAYASGDVTMGQFNAAQSRAIELVNQLGFEYLSLTGQHPADYTGAPDQFVVQNMPEAPHILPALTPAPIDALTHVIPVQIGQTSGFNGGDSITITEVRSNCDQFQVDGTYQVKGTYTLASHDRATVSISLTAKDPKNGWGYINKQQSMNVRRGTGTFTVTERFACEGRPHIKMAANEGSLCDMYFGSGDWLQK
jgi:beta-lactamase regulating signal transducer with metallopeptidase domain